VSTSHQVRNALGVVIRTFGTPTDAFEWANAHQGTEDHPGPLGWPLNAFTVETFTVERPISEGSVIPLRRAGGR
jgi:hypothetical protein